MTPPPPAGERRVRWGRIVLALAGAALLAFAAANMLSAANISATQSDTARDIASTGSTKSPPITETVPQATTQGGGTGTMATGNHARHRSTSRTDRNSGARRRHSRRAVGTGAALQGTMGTARAGHHHARGGGRGAVAAASSLPKTGASIWIAALVGIALLGGGVLMQVHAVRIAATALLYRRGPLLQPTWYARQGLPMAANAADSLAPQLGRLLESLGRLLEPPATESDFVGWRRRS